MVKPDYPIRAVAKLTGLSIDTLRAWERRYQAITPKRQGRGRLYEESDIARLNLLRETVEKGHSIGQIAALSDEQLRALLGQSEGLAFRSAPLASTPTDQAPLALQPLLSAIEHYDYLQADQELGKQAAALSASEMVHQVIIPLMQEVGNRWYKGQFSIAQEHMISAMLRNLLGALIRLYVQTRASLPLLFATPVGEQHEFGILAAAMLAARGGLGVLYLGASLPAKEIVEAAEKSRSQAVVLGFKGVTTVKRSLAEISFIAKRLPARTELWVGGTESDALIREIRKTQALFLDSFPTLERQLIRLGAQL